MPTLAEIRTRILERTDNQYTDGFIEDSEVNQLINHHYKRLYALLQRVGLSRAEADFTIAADGSAAYPLPADLYSVFAVFRDDSGTPCYLTRHDHRVRPSTTQSTAGTYRVKGLTIEFDPTPATGDYVVSYIPVPGTLVADDDELDGVLGWDEYVVLAASIDVMTKESIDPTMIGHVKGQLAELTADIKREARQVEMSEAPRIADVRQYGAGSLDTMHRGVHSVGLYPWRYGR